MEYDLHNSVLQKVALDIQDISTDTDTDGNVIDTLGFESIEFIATIGVTNAGTYTLRLEDSDTGAFAGEEAEIDTELVLGVQPVLLDTTDTAVRLGTITKKQFVRLTLVSAGSSGANFLGAVAILSNPHTSPTPAA